MSNTYTLFTEKDAIWADILVQLLKNNGIPCVAKPVHGAGMVVGAGVQERMRLYIPAEMVSQAEALMADYFPADAQPTQPAFKWTRPPQQYTITHDRVEIITDPHTDLWQRTYYHFRNDSAPVYQVEMAEKYFSFVVRTDFADSHQRFDQCGVVMYLNSENWLKASIEYENDAFQHLGSVVTNHGYSDWATTEIPATVKSMWYRLSRREDDFRIECSEDGETFRQMRICHMHEGGGPVKVGIYACSPEDSSFRAVFTDMYFTECAWQAHDGQQPD